MNKLLIVAVMGLLLVGCVGYVCLENNDEGVLMKKENIYQGPVRPTDDLEFFRETGITKPLEVDK